MIRIAFWRLVVLVPTLLGVTLLTFGMAHFAPGDPLQLEREGLVGAPAAAGSAYLEAQGLTRPLLVQYLAWVGRVSRLDFGRSLVDQRPVAERLAEALPRTALVSGLAFLVSWVVAVPLGLWLAAHERSRWARGVAGVLALSSAVPSFWVAVMALLLFASPLGFELFPFQGLATDGVEAGFAALVDRLWHLVLPVVVLAWPMVSLTARHVSSAVTEALAQEHVLAARARGIPEVRVLLSHALRSRLLPLITLAGLQLPHVLGGSVVVERVFGVPGMGLLAFEAVGTRDYPVVMGVVTVMALVTLGAMLLAELASVAADPRVRLGARP
jgi:peptide/nickel transport system permease protein